MQIPTICSIYMQEPSIFNYILLYREEIDWIKNSYIFIREQKY